MLDEAPKEGEGLKIKGSVMLALAESKEEVLEALKKDIYCTSGVWDWDKVQIHPVSLAAACRAGRVHVIVTADFVSVQKCNQETVVISCYHIISYKTQACKSKIEMQV